MVPVSACLQHRRNERTLIVSIYQRSVITRSFCLYNPKTKQSKLSERLYEREQRKQKPSAKKLSDALLGGVLVLVAGWNSCGRDCCSLPLSSTGHWLYLLYLLLLLAPHCWVWSPSPSSGTAASVSFLLLLLFPPERQGRPAGCCSGQNGIDPAQEIPLETC